MNISPTIMPVTKARSQLGELTNSVRGENYIILTKGGLPEAALVDFQYFTELQKEVNRIFQQTFIDPKLLPLTREFSDEEIAEWNDADRLT